MGCDFCGKVEKGMNDLNDCCTTKNVKVVCDKCAEKLSRKKRFFMFRVAERRMKIWIERNKK